MKLVNTYKWFYDRAVKIETLQHDPTNKEAAWKLAMSEDKLPIGIFYQHDGTPTLDEGFAVLKDKPPLVEQSANARSIEQLLEGMR